MNFKKPEWSLNLFQLHRHCPRCNVQQSCWPLVDFAFPCPKYSFARNFLTACCWSNMRRIHVYGGLPISVESGISPGSFYSFSVFCKKHVRWNMSLSGCRNGKLLLESADHSSSPFCEFFDWHQLVRVAQSLTLNRSGYKIVRTRTLFMKKVNWKSIRFSINTKI